MATEVIRKQIHGYIDKADDRFINLVHAMIVADLDEPELELSEDLKVIMDERLEDYHKNPEAGSPMKEVFERLRTQS